VFAIVDEACGGKFCARQVLEVESEGEALRSVAAVPCWPSSPPSLHASLMARLDWSSDRQVRPHQPLSHGVRSSKSMPRDGQGRPSEPAAKTRREETNTECVRRCPVDVAAEGRGSYGVALKAVDKLSRRSGMSGGGFRVRASRRNLQVGRKACS
jgi:hypothetical protein